MSTAAEPLANGGALRESGLGMVRPWRQFALWTALAAALVAVVCLGAAATPAWVGVDCGLFASVAILALGASWKRVALPWPALLWPALGFALLALGQWYFRVTVYPAATLTGLVQLAGCGCILYLSLFAFQRASNLRRAATVLWIFTGALGVEALAQYFTGNQHIYWYRDASYATPVGPYIYHNHFAGCVELMLPVALVAAFGGRRHRFERSWLRWMRRGILPGLGLAALVVSQSRGGFFTLLVEAGFGAVLFWRVLRANRRVRRAALAAAAALVAFTALAGWQPLVHRLLNLEYQDVSTEERVRVAASCVRIWEDHVWVGTGFETFPQVYPEYETFDLGVPWEEAHNEYAQALAEMGLVGLGFAAAFLVLLLFAALRGGKGLGGHESAIRRAALVGVLGFLFHCFGDFQFHSPANALLFFLCAGMAAGGVGWRVRVPSLGARGVRPT